MTKSQPQETPPINLDALREVLGGKREIEKRLLYILYQTGIESIAVLCNNINEETPGEWENAAHGLKGAAVNLYVNSLAELCEAAEDTPPEEIAHRQELCESIKAEFNRFKDYIHTVYPDFWGKG